MVGDPWTYLKLIVIFEYSVLTCLFFILVLFLKMVEAIIDFPGMNFETGIFGADDSMDHGVKYKSGLQVSHDDITTGLNDGVGDFRTQAIKI